MSNTIATRETMKHPFLTSLFAILLPTLMLPLAMAAPLNEVADIAFSIKENLAIVQEASGENHPADPAREKGDAPVAPDGFDVTKASAEGVTRFPMFAVFDDFGKLYVAEASGLDLYAELRKETRKCRIRRLEDLDGDGVFEHATVYADKLVYPMGLAWRNGELYVADPPNVGLILSGG